jgi:hypothetical protein
MTASEKWRTATLLLCRRRCDDDVESTRRTGKLQRNQVTGTPLIIATAKTASRLVGLEMSRLKAPVSGTAAPTATAATTTTTNYWLFRSSSFLLLPRSAVFQCVAATLYVSSIHVAHVKEKSNAGAVQFPKLAKVLN